MRQTDLIEFSTVVGDIYDAAIDPTRWQPALASVCAYVGGYSASLFWHDAATRNAQALYLFHDDPRTQTFASARYKAGHEFPIKSFILIYFFNLRLF